MSNDDKDIKDLFMRARRADKAEAPELNELMKAAGTPAPTRRRPLFAAAALGTLAAGALVLAALPLLRAPDTAPMTAPEPPPPILSSQPTARSEGTPRPPVAAPSKDDNRSQQRPASAKKPKAAAPAENEADLKRQPLSPTPERLQIQATPVEVKAESTTVTAPGQASRDTGLQYRLDGGNVTDPVSGPLRQSLNKDVVEMKAISRRAAAESPLAEGGFTDALDTRLDPAFNTESYAPLSENPFLRAVDSPVSTFSVDVDTASYSVVRRFLDEGRLPPPDAVRIEEMINYFPYRDEPPRGNDPFSVSAEIAMCPWEPRHQLVRIALKGKEVAREELAGSNLVFLVDVSGSMDEPAKLPLVVSSLRQLVSQLDGRDEVAIVVYAGSSGLVLPPTRGSAKGEILAALDRLRAGGSTNGGEGLRLAYATARRRFIEGGVNRVILATDGDFNVGITDRGELVRFVEDQAREGVFLTVLGFGMGNYKDDMLEMLADKGNGNYAYIDTPREARKALVEQIGGTLVTIAKDVKIQVEFNPEHVGAYRLIGYENRLLRREDFNDDRKDAGEIGSGHTVTALYELMPPGNDETLPGVDPLRYQTPQSSTRAAGSPEVFTVKLRYKDPDGQRSRLIERHVDDQARSIRSASEDMKFAAAVAAFGMILRDSSHRGSATLDMAANLARSAMDSDDQGYRREFVRLVQKAESLQRR